MAKKRKKTKAELREERRRAMERVRRETGWEPPPELDPEAEQAAGQALGDMLTLFPELAGDTPPDMGLAESYMALLLDSEDLADEKEFEGFYFHPMETLDTFFSISAEMGVESDELEEMDEETREEIQLEMLERTADHVLTDAYRDEILDRLHALRDRLDQEGQRAEAARAGSLWAFLGDASSEEMWPTIGLVLALVHRSFNAGFDLADVLFEAGSAFEAEGVAARDVSFGDLVGMVEDPKVRRRIEALMEEYPGLGDLMMEEGDLVWDEGVEALFSGELYMGFFRPEEIAWGVDYYMETFYRELDQGEGEAAPAVEFKQPDEETGIAFVSKVDSWIAGLLTPERIDQIAEELDEILDDPDLPEEWHLFVSLLREATEDEDAPQAVQSFMVPAFFGEMTVVIGNLQALEDGEGEDW
jgi:hypothetical protein